MTSLRALAEAATPGPTNEHTPWCICVFCEDGYASASRAAILRYADLANGENPKLATDLRGLLRKTLCMS